VRKSSEKSALNPPPKEKSSRATDSPPPDNAARRAGGEHDAHHEEGKDGKEQPGKGDHFCSAVARHLVPLDFVAVFGLRDFKKDFGFFEGVGVSHDDGVLWDGWHSLHTR